MCEFQPPNRTRAAHLIDKRKNMDTFSLCCLVSRAFVVDIVQMRKNCSHCVHNGKKAGDTEQLQAIGC